MNTTPKDISYRHGYYVQDYKETHTPSIDKFKCYE